MSMIKSYASDRAKLTHDGRLRDCKYASFALIICYNWAPEQAVHIDMREPYHNGALAVSNNIKPTQIFHTFGESIASSDEFDEYFTDERVKEMVLKMKGNSESAPQIAKQLRTTMNLPESKNHLAKFGNTMLPCQRIPNAKLMSRGSVAVWKGSVLHAGPSNRSGFCRAVLFFSINPPNESVYKDQDQFNRLTFWAHFLQENYGLWSPDTRGFVWEQMRQCMVKGQAKSADHLWGDMRKMVTMLEEVSEWSGIDPRRKRAEMQRLIDLFKQCLIPDFYDHQTNNNSDSNKRQRTHRGGRRPQATHPEQPNEARPEKVRPLIFSAKAPQGLDDYDWEPPTDHESS